MTFFRYRHNDRASESEWEYMEVHYGKLTPKEQIREVRQEVAPEGERLLSYGYRGTDVEIIDLPPKEWLESQIERSISMASSHSLRARRYQLLLKGTEEES